MREGTQITDPYVSLQKHLDSQPIGFPATSSRAEIKILKHIFSPLQARIACGMSHNPEPLEIIYERAGHLVDSSQNLEKELAGMLKKGGIEICKRQGKILYANTPLVVGMYELQLERLTPEFMKDFSEYSSDKRFGLAFLGTRHSQLRTIPVNESVKAHTGIAPYNDVKKILNAAKGPFVIVECICRKKHAIKGEPCKMTSRKETCLAMGDFAYSALGLDTGRQISREEALEIMDQNQKDGLVIQPGNAQKPDFICSCCSCCCGMLNIQKSLPRPVSFWSSGYQASIDADLCTGCGICAKRCQVEAIDFVPLPKYRKTSRKRPAAKVNLHRCIGCGLCVNKCPAQALTLNPRQSKKHDLSHPPETRQELHKKISEVKKDPLAKVKLIGRLAGDMLQTGDFGLLKKNR